MIHACIHLVCMQRLIWSLGAVFCCRLEFVSVIEASKPLTVEVDSQSQIPSLRLWVLSIIVALWFMAIVPWVCMVWWYSEGEAWGIPLYHTKDTTHIYLNHSTDATNQTLGSIFHHTLLCSYRVYFHLYYGSHTDQRNRQLYKPLTSIGWMRWLYNS